MDRTAAAARVTRAGARAALPTCTPRQVRLVTLVACGVLWEALARSGWFYKDVVPSLASVVAAVAAEVAGAPFYRHLGITFAEVSVGFLVGGLLGVACGVLFGARRFLGRAVEPYVNGIGSTPKIVFLPILFLMFGVGIESKMAKGALSTFFPVVITSSTMTTRSPLLTSPSIHFFSPWPLGSRLIQNDFISLPLR